MHLFALCTSAGMRRSQLKKLLLIMKLTTFFILIACLQVHAKGYSQQVTLSEKNTPLQKVLKGIEAQTGYVFFYEKAILEKAKPVTINVQNAKLEEVLEECFRNQPLIYSIVGTTIVLKPKPSTTGVFQPADSPVNNEPPGIDVSGKVTDTDGKPLEGASVTVKGTKIASRTDAVGVFILKGIDENATLEISYAEYETVILKVNKRTSISIALKQEIGKLGEVIINKGYYTEKQRNTVGNVTTVTAKDIEKQPVQNPLLALQGRVPGLEVTQLTGMNGGAVQIRIQGRNSITQGLDPLIVIDGVPFPTALTGSNLEAVTRFGSPLNYINPNDIESIDVLKDADATSIYGSRAANGAILITTKKGKAGKMKASLNFQQGWGKVSRRVDMMNTQQYVSMRLEALRNSNQIASSNPSAIAPFVYAPDLTIWDTTRYTDWQNVLIGGTAKYTNANLSLSGGSQAVQYLIGGTYNRTTTVFPGDFDDQKASFHFSINSKSLDQRLKLQFTGNYMYDNNHLPGSDYTQLAITLAPDAPSIYKPDGTFNWAPNAAGSSTWENPLATLANTDFKNATNNLVGNLSLNYRIAKGLDIGTRIGYTNMTAQLFKPTRLESFSPEKRPTAQRSASFAKRFMNSWIIEPQINYERQLGKGKLQAFIGTTIQKNNSDYINVLGSGFSSDQLMKSLQAATTISGAITISNITRYNALFGRFNYTWDNKYIVNFTARRDGSNKFGDNNKFSNFWSAGGAWIFTDEPCIQKSLPFLSFGKLRTSYGITGNDQISDFAYMSTYVISNPPILYQGGIGLDNQGIPNPYLRWELTRKWQTGIDLGLLKDRINLGFTYARNRSSNQLISYPLPAIAGNGVVLNLPATIQNTSVEMVLTAVPIRQKDFSWTTTANLTIPRNKLISFPGIENTVYKDPNQGIVVGQPLGIKTVSHYAGVNPATGRFLVTDVRGNPSSSGPLNIFLNLNSNYYAGLTNSFQYKGIQLDFLLQFVRKKGPMDLNWYNGTFWPGQFNNSSRTNQPITVLNHWQKPGDISFAPFYNTSGATQAVTNSDAFYSYDASFIRLKNVSLSWQMPAKWSQKVHFQSARLYVHAQNLATITNYTGIDPESGGTGMPPLRMITTGINIEF